MESQSQKTTPSSGNKSVEKKVYLIIALSAIHVFFYFMQGRIGYGLPEETLVVDLPDLLFLMAIALPMFAISLTGLVLTVKNAKGILKLKRGLFFIVVSILINGFGASSWGSAVIFALAFNIIARLV